MDFIYIVGAVAVLAPILAVWNSMKRRSQTQGEVNHQMRLSEIRDFQEQLARLTKESTRDLQAYKDAKEAYNAKYRSKPTDTTEPK